MNMKGDTLYAEGSRMRCFLKKLSNKHGQDKASFRKVKSKCLLHVSFVIGLVWSFKICISILWFEILKYKHTFFCYTLARSTFSLRLLQLLRKMCKLGKVQIETFYNLLLETKLSKNMKYYTAPTSSNAAILWTGSMSQIMPTISGGRYFRFAPWTTILRMGTGLISGTKWITKSMNIVQLTYFWWGLFYSQHCFSILNEIRVYGKVNRKVYRESAELKEVKIRTRMEVWSAIKNFKLQFNIYQERVV